MIRLLVVVWRALTLQRVEARIAEADERVRRIEALRKLNGWAKDQHGR